MLRVTLKLPEILGLDRTLLLPWFTFYLEARKTRFVNMLVP